MGRGDQLPDRNSKSWLAKDRSVYDDTNRILASETTRTQDNKTLVLEIINQAKAVAESSRLSLGQKIMLQLAPKPSSTEVFTSVQYDKIKNLLDIRLVDFKYNTGQEFIDGLKEELKETMRTILRFQREIKVTKETIENPKTIGREKTIFLEKLRNLVIGMNLSEQTFNAKIAQSPFKKDAILREIKNPSEVVVINVENVEKYKPTLR